MIGGLAYVGAVVGAGRGGRVRRHARRGHRRGCDSRRRRRPARRLGCALSGPRPGDEALQDQLDHGGLLLWVHVRDAAHEQRAVDILTGNGAEDVHVHDLPGSRDPADNPLTGIKLDPFLPDARI